MKETLTLDDNEIVPDTERVEHERNLDLVDSSNKLGETLLNIRMIRPDLLTGIDLDRLNKIKDLIHSKIGGSEEDITTSKLLDLNESVNKLGEKLLNIRISDPKLLSGIGLDEFDKIRNYINLNEKIKKNIAKQQGLENETKSDNDIEKTNRSTEYKEMNIMPPPPPSFEQIYGKKTPENMISLSDSLRSLLKNLGEIGDITGPDGYVYKKDYLIPLIGNLKGSDDENLNKVTRTFGLRDKVKYILLRQELDKDFKK